MLQKELRIARRITGGGAVFFNTMKNDKEFEIFLKGIWKYQWLNNKSKITKEIVDKFHEKTQGIADLVVKLFVNTQKRAINKGMDDISIDLIEKVWNSEFAMVNPMVEAIKSNNKVKKMKFEDIQEIGVGKANADLRSSTNKVIRGSRGRENKIITESRDGIEDGNIVSKEKVTKIKVADLHDKDVRKIVIQGKKNNNLTAYESLKEAGLITTLEDLLLEIKNT